MKIPIVTHDELLAFHASHLTSSALPFLFSKVFGPPPYEEIPVAEHEEEGPQEAYDGPFEYYEADGSVLDAQNWNEEEGEEEDDGLGYYPDGVKRTLTDEQIAMFRHSEIQQLLKEKRRREERQQEEKDGREGSGQRTGSRDSEEGPRSYSGNVGKVEQVEQPQPRVLGGGNKRKRGRKTMWDSAKKKRATEKEGQVVGLDYDEAPKEVEGEADYEGLPLTEGAEVVHPQCNSSFVPLESHIVYAASESDADVGGAEEGEEEDEEYEQFLEREMEELKSGKPGEEAENESFPSAAATVGESVDLGYDDGGAVSETPSSLFSPADTQTGEDASVSMQMLGRPTSQETPATARHQRRRIVYGDNDDDPTAAFEPAKAAGGIGTIASEKRVFLWPKIGP